MLNRNCIFKDIRECTRSRKTRKSAYCMHNMFLIHINSDENSILRNRCCCGETCGIVSHGVSQSHTGEASDVCRTHRTRGRRAGHRTSARSQENFIFLKRSPFRMLREMKAKRPPRNGSKATAVAAARANLSLRKFKGI